MRSGGVGQVEQSEWVIGEWKRETSNFGAGEKRERESRNTIR